MVFTASARLITALHAVIKGPIHRITGETALRRSFTIMLRYAIAVICRAPDD